MYRHVLCVYPYRIELSHNGFWPPLGLEVIAAALEPLADSIDVIDLRMESGRTADFLRPETDLVCFSVNWGKEVDFIREEIRSVPHHILTVVGGRHATEDPEKWLSDCPNVDVLVRGDGEEIVEEIADRRPLGQIAGVSYRLNGKVVHGPVRQVGLVREDLYPRRHLRRHTYKMVIGGYATGLVVDSLASSRGCPFNCTFCSFSRNPWGTKRNWSARSPDSVVREIEDIDAGVVLFVDDNFTHDPDRVGAICDLLIERGIRKRYAVNARVEIARRPDVLRKMERAGFSMLLLGIESAQDKTLRSMRKGFSTKQLKEYFRLLRKSSMILHGYFMVGNIGETGEEMLRIAPFARHLGLDTIMVNPLRNERYSGLAELVARSPGYRIAPDGKVCSEDCPPERLRQILREVNRTFYTPRQVRQVLWKLVRNRIITPGVIGRLPLSLVRMGMEHRRKARRKRARSAARAG